MEVFEVYIELAHEAAKEIVGRQLESVELPLAIRKQGESIGPRLSRAYTRAAASC